MRQSCYIYWILSICSIPAGFQVNPVVIGPPRFCDGDNENQMDDIRMMSNDTAIIRGLSRVRRVLPTMPVGWKKAFRLTAHIIESHF